MTPTTQRENRSSIRQVLVSVGFVLSAFFVSVLAEPMILDMSVPADTPSEVAMQLPSDIPLVDRGHGAPQPMSGKTVVLTSDEETKKRRSDLIRAFARGLAEVHRR